MTAIKFSWLIGLLGATAFCGCSQIHSSLSRQDELHSSEHTEPAASPPEADRVGKCEEFMRLFGDRMKVGFTSDDVRRTLPDDAWLDYCRVDDFVFYVGLPILDAAKGDETVFTLVPYPMDERPYSDYEVHFRLSGRSNISSDEAISFLRGTGPGDIRISAYVLSYGDGRIVSHGVKDGATSEVPVETPMSSEAEHSSLIYVPLNDRSKASKHLQKVFESKGLDGIADLTDHTDKTVSIHATWELAKGDSKRTDEFIARFSSDFQVHPPQWWQNHLKEIGVYENNCHYVPHVDMSLLKPNTRLNNGRYEVLADPSTAGFPFHIRVKDRHNDAEWNVEVWAVGRFVLGGVGVHQIELVVADDRLFVFGAESHGVYAEAFRLNSGKPVLRFSTCYWFNFSERWKL